MKTVLIIEDNPELKENTTELLELANYNVITASNGLEGYLKALSNLPDIVLCDIVMPQSDGLTFLSLIRENPITKNIPLVFFSAGSAPSSVKKGLERGADEYLRKPFTNEELLSVVAKYSQQVNEGN